MSRHALLDMHTMKRLGAVARRTRHCFRHTGRPARLQAERQDEGGAVWCICTRRLKVFVGGAGAGIRERVEAEAKGPDASEIPHKPWHWKDSQAGAHQARNAAAHGYT